jgi:hypothetical protein
MDDAVWELLGNAKLSEEMVEMTTRIEKEREETRRKLEVREPFFSQEDLDRLKEISEKLGSKPKTLPLSEIAEKKYDDELVSLRYSDKKYVYYSGEQRLQVAVASDEDETPQFSTYRLATFPNPNQMRASQNTDVVRVEDLRYREVDRFDRIFYLFGEYYVFRVYSGNAFLLREGEDEVVCWCELPKNPDFGLVIAAFVQHLAERVFGERRKETSGKPEEKKERRITSF